MLKLFTCFFSLILFATPVATQAPSTARYQVPTVRSDGWQTAGADSVGLDSNRLANLTQSLRAWPELGVHAILIERNGRLVYEEYFEGFDERRGDSLGRVTMTAESKHDLRSITKNVVSALVGIAHGEGKISSLDEPLHRPRWSHNQRTAALSLQAGQLLLQQQKRDQGSEANWPFMRVENRFRTTRRRDICFEVTSGARQCVAVG